MTNGPISQISRHFCADMLPGDPLGKPGVSAPIVGATKMQHLEDAAAAVDLVLSPEDVALLEEPYIPHPVLGHS